MELIGPTAHLPTPFLAVHEPDAIANVVAMQAWCDDRSIALRPHIKTHKSSHYARAQLDAGAIGLTCATLSEAVGLGEAGVHTDVFVAVPQVLTGAKIDSVRRAAELHDRLLLAVDSFDGLALLIDAGLPDTVAAMIEIDSGLGRTGVAPESAAELWAAAGTMAAGVFTHGGHSYVPGGASSAAADEVRSLADAIAGLAGGTETILISAGSTPTARLSARSPITEERPGTYVFGDRQQVMIGETDWAQVAAAIVTTVIGTGPGRVVVDAGAKALTKDIQPWLDGYGEVVGHAAARVDRLYDNQGVIVGLADGALRVGDRIAVIPNHICPVVNLFDEIVSVAGSDVHAIPVDLRGHLS